MTMTALLLKIGKFRLKMTNTIENATISSKQSQQVSNLEFPQIFDRNLPSTYFIKIMKKKFQYFINFPMTKVFVEAVPGKNFRRVTKHAHNPKTSI